MEHEVFVPVSAETLRQTLRDPGRVARCVPGLQQDAEETAGPLSGRLRIRIGGHTITYRGALALTEQDGVFTAEGEGTEVRGTGSVKLTLAVRLTETADGTTLVFTGGARAEGRLAELPAQPTRAAAHRLMDRFVARLSEEAAAPESSAEPGLPSSADTAADPLPDTGRDGATAEPADAAGPVEAFDGPASGELAADERGADERGPDEAGPDASDDPDEFDASDDPDEPVFDVDMPAAPLDGETASGEGDFLIPEEPPAEAAHARRTMIGRSAEEVDHAPPRGRYAPVPPPEAAGAGVTLRWVAPAAALALASAVVVGRALRRRK
ncbi:SRPBCC domain-containing protein [Streptomyces sp. AK02-01A]|uniref:SRPBCC domain-containing protein n=1 Tax=Streptomyces sp. AK02-01A TaxID=3028648 RepID=UPI0029AA39A6|nr:SRPBCC domain-containing protein [Streptomyces sp. AK02-01A]MDX3854034.1 SRPBCC domain-containing protein [Streptomyces sp. AK02-01A]